MRDGVELATDVYLPGDGAFPIIVVRTPYDKAAYPSVGGRAGPRAEPPHVRGAALRAGFGVVVQDKRGRYASSGTYRLFADDVEDGCDTVEWIASQPWCSGDVAVEGISYVGHTALAAAIANPPHLRCGVVTQAATDMFTEERFVDGVALTMMGAGGWNMLGGLDVIAKTLDEPTRHQAMAELAELANDPVAGFRVLPITDVPFERHLPSLWRDVLAHRDDPAWFPNTTTHEAVRNIRVPILHIGSWFDVFLRNSLRHFEYCVAESPDPVRHEHRLIIGPWSHGQTSTPPGPLEISDADVDYAHLTLAWIDRWTKDRPPSASDDHRVVLYVTGANRWRAASSWPPDDATAARLFLHGDGTLSAEPPDDESPDSFHYDPQEPYAAPSVVAGPLDHRAFHDATNLLRYTTGPLDQPLEVIGPLDVTLYAASSATDTDWLVELHDVFPDGREVLLAEGITRARYRHSRTHPEPLTPSEIVAYDIDVRAIAHLFNVGHAVQLVVTSGKVGFPRNRGGFLIADGASHSPAR
jgi:putative CocE/NonD family hydrolase